ncbi:MAG: MiaB/RimO family radical SAM methylthiotransferase [Kiritimatiellia bacterium]
MKKRKATVSFKTVGCRLNQAETAVIRASFEEAGFETVRFGNPCDICVIHGCAVTARAQEDSLRLARSVKVRLPDAFVILAGCAAEYLAKAKEFSYINLLAGQDDKFKLPAILGRRFCSAGNPPGPILPVFDRQRAIVRIQDGCDFRCAYCIVPALRGPGKSRPQGEILDEIARLVLCGYPEIILTGANIGCYADGRDRLPQLLEKIEAIPALRRFRISSLEIGPAAPDVIDFMAGSKKMCRFLHLPLQSGSDRILKAMGRPYNALAFAGLVRRASDKIGTLGLGTDIIAGFPGESADDFRATVRLVEELPFSRLHVFSFSPRPGTAACVMPGQVPGNEREARALRLIELGREKGACFARALAGKRFSLVVEKCGSGLAEGWTGEYVRARIRGRGFQLKQIVEFTAESAQGDILLGSAQT